MRTVGELRQQAERYRWLNRQITDPAVLRAICELARELEQTAEERERKHLIGERAHAIWVERGCPEGRDVEFWVAAEREQEGQREPGRRQA